jgi:membrane associated rhomboid family serine protease
MPFSERPYVRGYSNLFPQAVKWLLIANVAIFVIQFLFRVLFGEENYNSFFGDFYLSPQDVVDNFAVWQLVTYLFLHDPYGFMHILFNMLMLWMFGNDLEQSWGSRFFLKYYFICGVGAGICVLVSAALFRDPSPTIGASGGLTA